MKRILIVDDDEDALIGLERTLEDAGFVTTTAWSGEEALRLSDEGPFDLLLIDEHLCDLNSPMLERVLRVAQPKAALLLMRTEKAPAGERSNFPVATVCKWEHDEVKARVCSCLAA
jgi:DNA-binding response OmpR family regulator